MRRARPLAILGMVLTTAALAVPIDRGLVEKGTDADTTDGTTDGGVLLVKNNGTTRLRPSTCAAGSCTRAAPTADNEGLQLEDIVSWIVSVCAPTGETLSGAGTLEFWRRDPVIGLWGPMKGKHLEVTESSARCQFFPVEENDMAAANTRGVYRANGVTFSGTTGSLTVSWQACKRANGGIFSTPGCSA